jgi:hypothetical protein
MFRKILVITALVAVIGVLVFGAVNRTLAKNASESGTQPGNRRNSEQTAASSEQTSEVYNQGNNGQGQGQGQGRGGNGTGGNGTGEGTNLPPATPGDLSAEESAALLYMREEEKLAHDVYVTFYEQWDFRVFSNISRSEQTHTDAVKTLLDRYGLADPASSEIGVFTDPDLQALYTNLVARGSQSLVEAIQVGAAIEEIDILDLQERLAQTDNADIQQVFNNLLNGSYNHLRAFVSTLKTQTGETYQPQYLSADAYQAIINAGTEAGGNGGNGDGVGNGQGGNGGGGAGRGGRP